MTSTHPQNPQDLRPYASLPCYCYHNFCVWSYNSRTFYSPALLSFGRCIIPVAHTLACCPKISRFAIKFLSYTLHIQTSSVIPLAVEHHLSVDNRAETVGHVTLTWCLGRSSITSHCKFRCGPFQCIRVNNRHIPPFQLSVPAQ